MRGLQEPTPRKNNAAVWQGTRLQFLTDFVAAKIPSVTRVWSQRGKQQIFNSVEQQCKTATCRAPFLWYLVSTSQSLSRRLTHFFIVVRRKASSPWPGLRQLKLISLCYLALSSTPLKTCLLRQLRKPNCLTLCTGAQRAKNILATQTFNFIIPRLHKKISAPNILMFSFWHFFSRHINIFNSFLVSNPTWPLLFHFGLNKAEFK